jgi:hypothetical protein
MVTSLHDMAAMIWSFFSLFIIQDKTQKPWNGIAWHGMAAVLNTQGGAHS